MQIGEINIALGWIEMVLGIITGSILGMWSFAGPFPTPPGHKNYDDLSRRLVRLGHIAFFMLPVISILYGHHIGEIAVSDDLKRLGCDAFIVCMIGVPVLLFIASVYRPAKYLEVIPVSCGMFALALMSYGYALKFF